MQFGNATRFYYLVSYLRSLVVRELHRHCKGVGSIHTERPIVDDLFSTTYLPYSIHPTSSEVSQNLNLFIGGQLSSLNIPCP